MSKQTIRFIDTIAIFALANIITLSRIFLNGSILKTLSLSLLLIVCFILCNIFPSLANRRYMVARLRICSDGCELLLLFLTSTTCSIIYSLTGFLGHLPIDGIVSGTSTWILNTVIAIFVEAIVFWNGIIRVYMTSVQLGIRYRVLGIVFGFVPIAHLILLGIIIHTVSAEVATEDAKLRLNQARSGQKLCATKYPLLLVHGVFFRDSRYLNYWGRIPKELEANGAVIYYGNHQSAASVEDSAKELLERIQQLLQETGCEKVNIIAHSKGGLDCRYAISMLDAGKYIASLTTINTPHRGCEFADYLLTKIPPKQQQLVASTYNRALRKLGDYNPDFIAAVTDLTAHACQARNQFVLDQPGIYYQSIGSKLTTASSGRFPLNFTYRLVRHFDGFNDGLVGEESFPWGSDYHQLTAQGRRGISHGDVIDLNRENFKGFDVREFYVQLVNDLQRRGL